jgi:hypothetical protein
MTRPRKSSPLRRLAAAVLLALVTATPAAAAAGPVLGNYWSEFLDHWAGALKKQNGVVLFALGVGVVSLFIITRGKWKK